VYSVTIITYHKSLRNPEFYIYLLYAELLAPCDS